MKFKELIIKFLEAEIIPFIKSEKLVNDTIIVIGGSYSYGYSDENSDIDVYIFMKSGIGKLIQRFRQHLFNHIIIEDIKVQIIPMDLNNPINKNLGELLNNPNEVIASASTEDIFKFQNYIPLFDEGGRINDVKLAIEKLDDEFWSKRCEDRCCKTIDFLESFYSSTARCNVAAVIKYGQVVQALLQILYLSDNKAYAPDKWLYIALGEEHKNSLGKSQEVFLPQSLEINNLKISVDSINKYVTGILREKETIPDYVIEDMLNP